MPLLEKEQHLATNRKSLLDSFLACRLQLLRFIGRIVRPDEIEDIVQETFVQSYAAARNQKIENPRAFMFKTARNLALNSVQTAAYKLNSNIGDLEDFDIPSEVDLVEQHYQSEEKFLSFCRAVSTLPLNCRKVFILKKVYGLSQKEIAAYLNISTSTIEKHIAKGMSITAAYMYKDGYISPVKGRPVSATTAHDTHTKEQSF